MTSIIVHQEPSGRIDGEIAVQLVKVDFPMKRTIHHEDAEAASRCFVDATSVRQAGPPAEQDRLIQNQTVTAAGSHP